MAEIIPFPEGGRNHPATQKTEYDPIGIHIAKPDDGFHIDVGDCTELIHNFDEVPGFCRCGERTWNDLSEPPMPA